MPCSTRDVAFVGGSAGIAVLAPVSTVAQAIESAAAGAQLVDVGPSDALIPAIRRTVRGVRICGHGQAADIVRDADLASRTGAGLICPDATLAASAVRRGIAAERIIVQAAPAGIGSCSRSGWAPLVDLEQWADSLPRAGAIAAVCAWLGASVIRTGQVAEVRRCLDMTESILGVRPPARATRGLA